MEGGGVWDKVRDKGRVRNGDEGPTASIHKFLMSHQ